MGRTSKTLVLLVLASIVALPATALLIPGPVGASPPAGCHGHEKSPQPGPAGHWCCQIGHQSAVLQEPVPLTPLAVAAPLTASQTKALSLPIPVDSQSRQKSSATSPGLPPLRI
jgi:hypothetical protein